MRVRVLGQAGAVGVAAVAVHVERRVIITHADRQHVDAIGEATPERIHAIVPFPSAERLPTVLS